MNIVYVAFRGHFSDSPRALYEELRAHGVDATHTWLSAPHTQSTFPDDVATVPFGSPESIAALEGATRQDGHAMVLPFLGMARAELTDFGQRRPARYVLVQVGDLRSGLAELEQRLTALLADSQVLQHSLRLDSARRLLRLGAAAVA